MRLSRYLVLAACLLLAVVQRVDAANVGTHTLAVVLLNWPDDMREPVSPETVHAQSFSDPGSQASYYLETSYGLLAIGGRVDPSGDVFGWLTITEASTLCNYSAWGLEARAQLLAQGIDLGLYDHVEYAWPFNSACSQWTGITSDAHTSYLNAVFDFGLRQRTATHELGHQLGAAHANMIVCHDPAGNQVQMSADCTYRTTEDPFDVMDNSFNYQMNAQHRRQLGWFQPSNTRVASASGDYCIAPVEADTASVKLLDIVPPSRPHDAVQHYYLDVRQAGGYFDQALSPLATGGVHLHLDYPGFGPDLVDATPESAGSVLSDDEPLPLGRTFTDTIRGVAITTTAIGPAQGCVHITVASRPPK